MPDPHQNQTTKGMRWNLPPGGDNTNGPRASDGAITGIDGADPGAIPQHHADPHRRPGVVSPKGVIERAP